LTVEDRGKRLREYRQKRCLVGRETGQRRITKKKRKEESLALFMKEKIMQDNSFPRLREE
jgi:hypothetical protein